MRTPLFRSLRQLIADLKVSQRTATPLDVVREERRVRAAQRKSDLISRRSLLGGAAVAAGLLALPKGARAAASQPKVASVGAGMAGMACAGLLQSKGVSFTVYEASTRIGGRMYSNNDRTYWDEGQVTEWGGELIDTNHRTMHRLARKYGLVLDDLTSTDAAGADEVYKVGGAYYPKTQADEDFLAMLDVVDDDEAAAGYPTTWDSYTTAGRALDQMSVRDWIATRVPGGHRSPLGQVLDIAYNIEYGAETDVQSALNLLYLLAYQPAPHKLATFGESDERYHIRGGNQQLPQAIAATLPSGTIEFGMKLVKLARTPAGRTACTFVRGGSTTEVVYDYVVLCMPFAMLASVDYAQAGFDDRKTLAIRELGRGHNAKVQLQFRTRSWDGRGAWPGVSNGTTFADTGYQASWEPTRGQPGTAGILNLYSGGAGTDALKTDVPFATSSYNKTRQDAERGLAQISQVFPGLDWNGKATASIWPKNPFTQHSYAFWKVGQYTAFGGYEGVRQGGVLFAGDHTSQDFQGFMNGAASEGERAALELVKLL
ncbi:MAG: NAD(P)/FAD-dependent oxidoreductase [Myxococcota bacterium]